MTGRLIVVSNRIPLDAPPAGGLVVALDDCLRRQGGLWIGADDTDVETPREKLVEREVEHYRKFTFDLTAQDRAEYYLGYSNAVLWPLCHRRADLIDFRPCYREGYMRVNWRLARVLAAELRPDDTLWVHDYHFFPLAALLRELGVRTRIGFFLHIPFPTRTDLDTITDREAFLRWIAAFDLVGLQSQADVAACLSAFRRADQGELYHDGTVGFDGSRFHVRSFPIGIAPQDFADAATKKDGAAAVNLVRGHKFLIGVDRLDYSKGIPQRLRAFETWLENRGPDTSRATLLQIAPPSRSVIRAYREIRMELEQIAGEVNGSHGELDWTPIRYIHRNVPRDDLAPLFRAADAALVTPLADGMNLVAKEFVAAQDPDDPGVLILSRFAGAAEQLTSSVIVNPYDRADTARGIAQALTMSLDERRARHGEARKSVFEADIDGWADDFLGALMDSQVQLDAAG